MASWCEVRKVMGSDWTVTLETDTVADGYTVTLKDGAGETRHATFFETWAEAAQAWTHPFASADAPTPWEARLETRSPVAYAEALTAEHSAA